MSQINPFSGYPADAVSLDRHLIDDRPGGQARRDLKRPKPKPQAEDQVELHTEEDESPAPELTPVNDNGEGGHVDVTA